MGRGAARTKGDLVYPRRRRRTISLRVGESHPIDAGHDTRARTAIGWFLARVGAHAQ